MIDDFCTCGGPRFILTISATNPASGERETGPTRRVCGMHLVAARAASMLLGPEYAIDFEITPADQAEAVN